MTPRVINTGEKASKDKGMAANPWLTLFLQLLAVLLGTVAQWLVDGRVGTGIAVSLYIVAALLFARVAPRRPDRDLTEGQRDGYAIRWFLLIPALALGVVAWWRLSGNRFTLLGTASWLGSIGCLAAAIWPVPKRAKCQIGREGLLLSWPCLAVFGSVLLGGFFRLYRIQSVPLEMGCDLPLIQANIGQILEGEYPIFFTSHPGREALFFYLAAPVAAIGGLGHTSIKVASALIGVATLPAIYWLGSELYGRWVGVCGAFFLAISHWHIIITRVGYRAAIMPLLLTLAWLFLARGLKHGRVHDYALAGFFVGLGLHSYNAFMLVPLLFFGILVFARLTRPLTETSVTWLAIGLWLVFLVSAALPLVRFAYEQPDQYLFRAATRITAMEQPIAQGVVVTLVRNIGRALGMFNYVGDVVFTSNVPYYRQLGFASAVLFVLGFGQALVDWRHQPNALSIVLLVGLLMPSTAALAFPQEVPSAVRAVGVLPAAVMFPAIALGSVGRVLAGAAKRIEPAGQMRASGLMTLSAAAGAIALGLSAEALAVYPLYFHRYVEHQPHQNQSISLKLARAIDGIDGSGEAYLMIWPHWYDGNAVRAQLRKTPSDWDNELWELIPGQPPLGDRPGRYLVILHPEEGRSLAQLQNHFVRYVVIEQHWDDGTVAFRTFYGER